jgi:hypothetical protein
MAGQANDQIPGRQYARTVPKVTGGVVEAAGIGWTLLASGQLHFQATGTASSIRFSALSR